MDRIEPVSPSQRAIPPIDPARVKVRRPDREEPESQRRRDETARKRAESERRESASEPEDGDDDLRHIDVCA
jgi:hypothetical protein